MYMYFCSPPIDYCLSSPDCKVVCAIQHVTKKHVDCYDT